MSGSFVFCVNFACLLLLALRLIDYKRIRILRAFDTHWTGNPLKNIFFWFHQTFKTRSRLIRIYFEVGRYLFQELVYRLSFRLAQFPSVEKLAHIWLATTQRTVIKSLTAFITTTDTDWLRFPSLASRVASKTDAFHSLSLSLSTFLFQSENCIIRDTDSESIAFLCNLRPPKTIMSYAAKTNTISNAHRV